MTTTATNTLLRERADRMHKILEEEFYDPAGLMLAYIDIHTRKPLTAEQLADYPITFPGRPPIQDWFSHENTPVVVGNYLSALSHRANVVPGAQTDRMIERAMACLRKNYDMSVAFKERGWLCKPWGGRPSDESTNDQYGGAIGGLRDLTLVSGHPVHDEARRLVVELCDYWMRHDYVCPYHGVVDHRWMGGTQWGLVCMAFVRIAHELTGERRYADETERLCREYHCDEAEPWAGSFVHGAFPDRPDIGVRRFSAYHHLVCEYLDALCDTWPQRRDDWQKLLTEFWRKDIEPGLADDGLLHACYEIDKRTLKWRPCEYGYLFPPGTDRNSAIVLHQHWVGPYKSGSMTCHVASSAVKVGRCVPELRDTCRAIALRVLESTDETKMATVIDEEIDHRETPGLAVRQRMFDGRAPAQWLRAYWQGRELGWWD